MYIEWKDGIPYDKYGQEIQFLSDRQINEFHIHLDTEEEYERHAIAADYGDFLDFMCDCPSVYAITSDNEKYLSDRGKKRKLYPYRFQICDDIARSIDKGKLNPDIMPYIPIVEYKLVPTGNIWYYNPNSTTFGRQTERAKELNELKKHNKKKRLNVWKRYQEEEYQAQVLRMMHAREMVRQPRKGNNEDE